MKREKRAIEDVGAFIVEVDGTAWVCGHPSGPGLAMHAAAHCPPIAVLVLHELPLAADREEQMRVSRNLVASLRALLTESRRGDAAGSSWTPS